jgi:hypothetical protein
MELRDPLTIAVNAVADAIWLNAVPPGSVRRAEVGVECYRGERWFVVTNLELWEAVRCPEDFDTAAPA